MLALVCSGCFFASINIAEQINERLYVIVVFGLTNVQRYNLHIVNTRPRIIVSNGDRAPELHGFILFLATIFIGFPMFFFGLSFVQKLSGLLGGRVDFLQEFAAIPQKPQPTKTRWHDVVFDLVTLGLAAGLILAMVSKSLWLSALNYAALVCIAGFVLRLTPPMPKPHLYN